MKPKIGRKNCSVDICDGIIGPDGKCDECGRVGEDTPSNHSGDKSDDKDERGKPAPPQIKNASKLKKHPIIVALFVAVTIVALFACCRGYEYSRCVDSCRCTPMPSPFGGRNDLGSAMCKMRIRHCKQRCENKALRSPF